MIIRTTVGVNRTPNRVDCDNPMFIVLKFKYAKISVEITLKTTTVLVPILYNLSAFSLVTFVG